MFGYKTLRLVETSNTLLEGLAGKIDEQLAKHGETVCARCIGGLAGGSPQMLWPSLSDCVFAVVAHVAGHSASSPVVEEHTIAHHWVFNALTICQLTDGRSIKDETCERITKLLLDLARDGPKSKPKAKMLLTDFAKICKGEMGVDSLLAYTL
jgi:hypothetical protein